MKVTFVHSQNESLAVETLSALLKKNGHSVDLAYDHRYFARTAVSLPALARIFDERDLLTKKVAEGKPDLVCFSVHTCEYQWALDMARRIKRQCDVPVLFGGVHTISVPEVVISEDPVDMLCDGEGEKPLLELMEQLENYPDVHVPGIWVKTESGVRKFGPAQLVSDLDSVPLPDKEIFYSQLPWLSCGYLIATGRGCPYSCTFCGNNTLRHAYKGKGRYVRKRSVDNVMEEMIKARDQYSPGFFNIIDDCLTSHKPWLEEFCRRYKGEVGLPFVALTRAQLVDDNSIRRLKDAGCYRIQIGVESTSELTRRGILNRKETNEQIRKAAEIFHRHDILFSVCHILALPYEAKEEYRHALEFYNELRPSVVNPFWLVYFPRTKIVDIALEAGLIGEEDPYLIDRGLANTSQSLGIGRGKQFEKVGFKNYAFLLSIIPLLPRRAIEVLVSRRIYFDNWNAPVFLISVVRVLALVKDRTIHFYFGIALGILRRFFKSAYSIARYNLGREKL